MSLPESFWDDPTDHLTFVEDIHIYTVSATLTSVAVGTWREMYATDHLGKMFLYDPAANLGGYLNLNSIERSKTSLSFGAFHWLQPKSDSRTVLNFFKDFYIPKNLELSRLAQAWLEARVQEHANGLLGLD